MSPGWNQQFHFWSGTFYDGGSVDQPAGDVEVRGGDGEDHHQGGDPGGGEQVGGQSLVRPHHGLHQAAGGSGEEPGGRDHGSQDCSDGLDTQVGLLDNIN